MKINKTLLLNSEPVNIVSHSVRLNLFSAGRAIFTITNAAPQKGQLVEFNIALGDRDLRRCFLGFIESITKIKKGVYQVFAREFAAILNQRIALNLRHCTPKDVLKAISEQTGQEFVLPSQNWTNQTIARFQHIGGGYGALDALLKLWSVKQGVWVQQSDGRVFVGPIVDSVPGSKTINLDANIFQQHTITGGTLPIVPRIRPGVHITIEGYAWVVHTVDIVGDSMRLQWSENLWSTNLRAVS